MHALEVSISVFVYSFTWPNKEKPYRQNTIKDDEEPDE